MQAVGLVDQQSPSPRGHVVKTIGDFLQTLKLSGKENKVSSFHLFNNILLLFPHFCAHLCAFLCFIRQGAFCSKPWLLELKGDESTTLWRIRVAIPIAQGSGKIVVHSHEPSYFLTISVLTINQQAAPNMSVALPSSSTFAALALQICFYSLTVFCAGSHDVRWGCLTCLFFVFVLFGSANGLLVVWGPELI